MLDNALHIFTQISKKEFRKGLVIISEISGKRRNRNTKKPPPTNECQRRNYRFLERKATQTYVRVEFIISSWVKYRVYGRQMSI